MRPSIELEVSRTIAICMSGESGGGVSSLAMGSVGVVSAEGESGAGSTVMVTSMPAPLSEEIFCVVLTGSCC